VCFPLFALKSGDSSPLAMQGSEQPAWINVHSTPRTHSSGRIQVGCQGTSICPATLQVPLTLQGGGLEYFEVSQSRANLPLFPQNLAFPMADLRSPPNRQIPHESSTLASRRRPFMGKLRPFPTHSSGRDSKRDGVERPSMAPRRKPFVEYICFHNKRSLLTLYWEHIGRAPD